MAKKPLNKRCPYGEDCPMIPTELYADHVQTHAKQLDLLTGQERGLPEPKPKRRRERQQRLA